MFHRCSSLSSKPLSKHRHCSFRCRVDRSLKERRTGLQRTTSQTTSPPSTRAWQNSMHGLQTRLSDSPALCLANRQSSEEEMGAIGMIPALATTPLKPSAASMHRARVASSVISPVTAVALRASARACKGASERLVSTSLRVDAIRLATALPMPLAAPVISNAPLWRARVMDPCVVIEGYRRGMSDQPSTTHLQYHRQRVPAHRRPSRQIATLAGRLGPAALWLAC